MVGQMLPKLEYYNISRKTQARSYCENRTSEICDINSSARKFLQINYNKSMKTYSSWNMYILWLYSVELRDLLPMPYYAILYRLRIKTILQLVHRSCFSETVKFKLHVMLVHVTYDLVLFLCRSSIWR